MKSRRQFDYSLWSLGDSSITLYEVSEQDDEGFTQGKGYKRSSSVYHEHWEFYPEIPKSVWFKFRLSIGILCQSLIIIIWAAYFSKVQINLKTRAGR